MPTLMDAPDARLAGIPLNVTAPLAGAYVALAPPGSPVKLTPVSPGTRPSTYVIPLVVDGPLLLYVVVALTVLPATAVGGTVTLVVTSASGEIAVVPLALSVSVLAPWLVAVPIVLDTVTDPAAGAV